MRDTELIEMFVNDSIHDSENLLEVFEFSDIATNLSVEGKILLVLGLESLVDNIENYNLKNDLSIYEKIMDLRKDIIKSNNILLLSDLEDEAMLFTESAEAQSEYNERGERTK